MGLFDSILGSSGSGGQTAGNLWDSRQNKSLNNSALPPSAWMDEINNSRGVLDNNTVGNATNAVQSNPLYSGLFGQNGQLQQAEGEATDLSKNGFNLTDTDKTAYGEAAGNIARQFGQNDQSLSQALSDRGLSNSGVAGAAFTNSLGNKNEQLAGLQTQIAQQRMAMNQQRLAQTRQFIGQLGAQAQGAVGQQLGAENQRGQNMFNNGSQMIGNQQNQANENLEQYAQTNHESGLGSALKLAAQGGLMYATGGMSGLSGATKGMAGGTQPAPTSSYLGGGKTIDFSGKNPYE